MAMRTIYPGSKPRGVRWTSMIPKPQSRPVGPGAATILSTPPAPTVTQAAPTKPLALNHAAQLQQSKPDTPKRNLAQYRLSATPSEIEMFDAQDRLITESGLNTTVSKKLSALRNHLWNPRFGADFDQNPPKDTPSRKEIQKFYLDLVQSLVEHVNNKQASFASVTAFREKIGEWPIAKLTCDIWRHYRD